MLQVLAPCTVGASKAKVRNPASQNGVMEEARRRDEIEGAAELFMAEFNAFWRKHLPELKPTAGYPTDAARYLKAIRPTLATLQIRRELIDLVRHHYGAEGSPWRRRSRHWDS